MVFVVAVGSLAGSCFRQGPRASVLESVRAAQGLPPVPAEPGPGLASPGPRCCGGLLPGCRVWAGAVGGQGPQAGRSRPLAGEQLVEGSLCRRRSRAEAGSEAGARSRRCGLWPAASQEAVAWGAVARLCAGAWFSVVQRGCLPHPRRVVLSSLLPGATAWLLCEELAEGGDPQPQLSTART